MRSNVLTPVQHKAVRAGLTPLVSYLAKLRERIHERGFEIDNELRVLVAQAHDAMDRLFG